MRRQWIALVGSVSLMFAAANVVGAEPAKKSALLIGVSKYNHAEFNRPVPLTFPETDAREIAEVLKESGYEIKLLLGSAATQAAIREALDVLRRTGSSDGVVLVGVFGHGVELADSKAYFCPYDAGLDFVKDETGNVRTDSAGVEMTSPDLRTLISLPDDILRAMKLCPAGNKIFLADACRNDPSQPEARAFGAKFSGTKRAFGTNLTINDLPENMAVLLACSRGQYAIEHKSWGHGAFTKVLLEEFRAVTDDGLFAGSLGDALNRKVRALVQSATNETVDQRPYSLVNGAPLATCSCGAEQTNDPMEISDCDWLFK